jgi:uncharacterized protein (TIGR02466 family)
MNSTDAIRQAVALMQSRRQAESVALCQKVLALDPGQPDALHLLAIAARDRGDVIGAERLFRQALSGTIRQADILVNFGNFLLAQSREQEARAHLSEAVASAPALMSGWYHLGLLCLKTGDLSEALRCAKRATDIAPRHAPAWELLAAAEQASGAVDAATATCRRGIRHGAPASRLQYCLGQLLRQACDFGEAAEAYEAALKHGHTTPDTFSNLAEAWLEAGNPDKAMAAVDRGVELFPVQAQLHRLRARLHWELQAPGDPLQLLWQSARTHSSNPDLWHTLADLLNRLERRDEARAVLVEARSRGCPDSPELRLLDALALVHIGKDTEATRALEVLDAACPGNSDIKLAFAAHLLATGDPGRAESLCGEVLQATPFDQLALAYIGTAWQLLQDPRERWLLDYQEMVRQVEIAPPTGFATRAQFFEALAELLTSLHHTRAHPIEQTLRSGTQTNGFLFRLKYPLLRQLEQQIRAAVGEVLATFRSDPHHPFWGRRGDGVAFSGAWSVRLTDGGFHTNHMHPAGWISSALYVALPDEVRQVTDQSGCIQFGVPLLDKDLGLAPRRVIKPEVGTLVLFPSYMWHGTIPFHSEQPRMTIAFDLLPEASQARGG